MNGFIPLLVSATTLACKLQQSLRQCGGKAEENEIVSRIVSLMCNGEPAQYFLPIKTEPLLAFRSDIAAVAAHVLLFDGEWKNSFTITTCLRVNYVPKYQQ